MTEARLLGLLPHLPQGVIEIYFHPAVEHSAALAVAMPGYSHTEELAALLSPDVRRRIEELGIQLVSYGELTVGKARC